LIELMTKFEPSERVKMGYVVDKLNEIAHEARFGAAP
ncbi:Mitogen-activated protein kinase kinase, partial [Globisporangium polare]